jgi:hypothetical protein
MNGPISSHRVTSSGPFEKGQLLPLLVAGLVPLGTGLIVLAGAAFLWRRISGALALPLGGAFLLVVGACAVGIAVIVRRTARSRGVSRLHNSRVIGLPAASTGPHPSPLPKEEGALPGSLLRRRQPLELLISAGILMIGAGLSLPGTGAIALLCFWTLLAAEESWAWRQAILPARTARAEATTVDAANSPVAALENEGIPPPENLASLIQQIHRSRLPDGSELLSGWVRVRLTAGQRVASVHVAFCPPFPRVPEMRVEQYQGPPMQIKTVQLQSFGARLDVKLVQPGESAAEAVLKFSVESGPAG